MNIKKALCLFAVLLLLVSLCACGKNADTSKWQANETFSSVPVYEYADTGYAEFSTAMNVKVEKTDYDDFAAYVSELKKAGFEYLPNGSAPENYALSGGSASWRGTNGKVWLQLIFNEEGTSGYEMFGCCLQIYGYNSASFLVPESEKDKKNSKDKETGKDSGSENAATRDETKSE